MVYNMCMKVITKLLLQVAFFFTRVRFTCFTLGIVGKFDYLGMLNRFK